MPYKDPEKRKQYNKEYRLTYYQRNKTAVKKRVYANKKLRQQEYRDFKSTLCCERCGYDEHPDALDFHHVVKLDDNRKVNELIRSGYFSAAYSEMDRCIVLCANCHRRHHALEHTENAASA